MSAPSPFIIYDASAGSGKTFTLVRNYISDLLLAPHKTAYKNILAITFTNKAVAEMKTRIIENLSAFSLNSIPKEHQDLFEAVQEKTQLSKEDIQKKAKAILKSILHNYAAFEVSTIDSFTHRILRSFARDLNIPVNFEVHLETDEILEEAVDRVIAKAGQDKKLTKTLIDFALYKISEDKSWDISFDLNEIAKLLVNENNLPYIEQLRGKTTDDFDAFGKEIQKEINGLEQQCLKYAQAFFDLIEKNNVKRTDFTRKSIPNFFQKILDGELKFPPKKEVKWQTNIETQSLYPKRIKSAQQAIIDGIQPEIASIFRNTESALYRKTFLKKIQSKNPSLSLLAAIEHEVTEIKKERDLLLISEFNKRIFDEIKNEPSPYIYFRLGDRYSIYYIDEFQDTSVLQWENLKPLIADSLSKEKGKLTLVGDAKQSIYRWRGGKAEQFMALVDDENPFHRKKSMDKLPYNFRSLPQVVNFNNRFFGFAAQFLQHQPYKDLFNQAPQKLPQKALKKEEGYVEVSFVEAENNEERLEKYPEHVLEKIQKLKNKNHPLSDICILVRRKKEGVAIAQYLNEHDIDIISSETLLLSTSPKVQFIINLLELSLNPKDQNLKFELLDFLYEQLKPKQTNFQFIQPKLDLNQTAFFESLNEYDISFNLKKLERLPIYDAAEYIIRNFQLTQNQDAYLQFFLDFVFEYGQSHSGGISGLIDLWELKKDKLSIIAPEAENAVRIMTIHKAKGLEFPIVIFPFANQSLTGSNKDQVWIELDQKPNTIPVTHLNVSKASPNFGAQAAKVYQELTNHNEMDAMNVFYVVLTRAEKQLYILSEYEKKEENNTFPGLLVNFLKEEGKWDDNALVEEKNYSFGKLPKAKTMEKETAQKKEKLFISLPPEAHSVNIVTRSGELWETPQQEAIEQGKLMHDLLQDIYKASDLDAVLKAAVRNGFLLEEEIDFYRSRLKAIINHPDLKEYFTDNFKNYTEQEILYNKEFKRLDRLCVSDKKTTVIDYKTGNYTPQHEQQISDYANAINSFGYTVQDKLLVYITEDIQIKYVA